MSVVYFIYCLLDAVSRQCMIFDRMLYPALMAIYSSSHTFHYDFAYM